MLKIHNENPDNKRVGDCVVRAISSLTGQDWETTFLGLTLVALEDHDMPSSNAVWGKYLRRRGYTRHALPDTCPDCFTVGDFANMYQSGTFMVACDGHVVAVKDGEILDTYDSSDIPAIYFWQKEA